MPWVPRIVLGVALAAAGCSAAPAAPAPPTPAPAPAPARSPDGPLPPAPAPAWWAELEQAETAFLLDRLEQASRDAGSYPGQFADLAPGGERTVRGLFALARNYDGAHAAADYRGDHWSHEWLAEHAVRALGDLSHPMVLPGLRHLRTVVQADPDCENDDLVDQLARALHQRGDGSYMAAVIAGLERNLDRGPPDAQRMALERLAHRYLHAGRTRDAVDAFESLGARWPFMWGNAFYNAACAWSVAGKPQQALRALRAAITADVETGQRPYDDVDWMQQDGDLAPVRALPGFAYLLACALARFTLPDPGEGERADPAEPSVQAVLAALREADLRGYAIEHPSDRMRFFRHLRGLPEFDALWVSLGG